MTGPRTWLGRLAFTLTGGLCFALALGVMATSVLALPLRWKQSDRRARDDTARCDLAERFDHTEVHLSEWGGQDTCGYFDAAGHAALVTDASAGPVVRERTPIRNEVVPVTIAALCIIGTVGALGAVAGRARSAGLGESGSVDPRHLARQAGGS